MNQVPNGLEMIETYHDDCLNHFPKMPDGCIDAIITDPPYGTTERVCKWDIVIPFTPMWKALHRIIKPNGAIVLFGSEPFSSALRMSNIKNYKYDWVYVKSQAQNFLNAKRQPLRNNECVSVFYKKPCTYNPVKTKGVPYKCIQGKLSKSFSHDLNIRNGGQVTISNGDRYPLSVMNKFNAETGLHPTQKPVALMEYLIKTYTNPGETVLDFTMGSGTTGVACIKTGRKFIGIEKEKKWYDIAGKRLKDHTMQTTLSL